MFQTESITSRFEDMRVFEVVRAGGDSDKKDRKGLS